MVKSALSSQGYPRSVLLQFPEGNSQGSRELLLALSWLLARGPLLEQLLAQTRVQLGDQLPQCEWEALASPGPSAPLVETKSPVDLRLVEWLMGKLRIRWRRLISSQQEQCTLLSKVIQSHGFCHWACVPCAPGCLSLSPLLASWTAGLLPLQPFQAEQGPALPALW